MSEETPEICYLCNKHPGRAVKIRPPGEEEITLWECQWCRANITKVRNRINELEAKLFGNKKAKEAGYK